MDDKIISIDCEKNKMVVLKQIEKEDGTICEEEVEVDIPAPPLVQSLIRRVKFDDNGRMYETEEVIEVPFFEKKSDE